jgi:DNA invertase Pin-like site-specific DNA recombinase
VLIGYARTSTLEQMVGFDAQLRNLEGAGAERIFREQVSSVAECPQLALALDFLRAGDVLLVTKLDRLARSTANLLEIVQARGQGRRPAHSGR